MKYFDLPHKHFNLFRQTGFFVIAYARLNGENVETLSKENINNKVVNS